MIQDNQNIYKVLNIGLYIPKYRTANMSLMTEEYKIDAAFLRQPWKKLTYSEIQEISGKKSKSYIYRAIKRLQDNGIVFAEPVGKSILYGLKLDSLRTQNYLGFLEDYRAWTNKHVPLQVISDLSNKLSTTLTTSFSLIVTGSYAKGGQNKSSDLDVVVVCDDFFNSKKIYAELKYFAETSIPHIHLYVFNKKEFLAMLLDKKENYGKEIARYHLIFRGGTEYYALLKGAIDHGFRG